MVGNLAYNLRDSSYSEILKNNIALSKNAKGKDFTVDVLSNITVNPMKEILEFCIRSLSLNPVIRFGNYDNIVQDTFSIEKSDLVIVFFELVNLTENFHIQAELLSPSKVDEIVSKCKRDIDLIFNNLSGKPMVIFNKFSSLPFTGSHYSKRIIEGIEQEVNHYLVQHKPDNVRLVDINRVSSSIGTQAYDKKKFLKYKSLYKIEFFKHYVSAIENLLLRRTGKLKKAFIFDCDNTLWKGVIGEDGPDGIDMSVKSEIGIHYHQVQEIAVALSQKGVLICLCSKNNQAEVDGLLGKHSDMVLNPDHIVAMKVNWDSKAENLRSLSEDLNIGFDSFVFVDDSEFEVNLIRTSLPEVLTIQVPKDLSQYPDLILSVAQRYFNLEPLKEDLKKVKIYKEQAQRTDAMNTIGNIDDYLATLETKVVITKDSSEQIQRVAQLTQKTNQFNLTTKRYSETEIITFVNSPKSAVFTIDVSDRFGDSGITGVIILKESQEDESTIDIDSCLLSCRILGRKIEVFFLNYVLKFCKENDYKTVRAYYSKTNKNGQVSTFYNQLQFEVEKSSEDTVNYKLDMAKYIDTNINFITLIEKQHT
jgi:FkbH-like protein